MKKIVYLIVITLVIAIFTSFFYAKKARGLCPQRMQLTFDVNTVAVPYCSNYDLSSVNKTVERAVIVIHGMNRNADDYYAAMLSAAKKAGNANNNSFILAPQFLSEGDITYFNLGDEMLFWTKSGWKVGHKSRRSAENPRPIRISSFAVIDEIIERFADKTKFPQLKKIIVIGHSAGGQFTNRFAAGSQVEQDIVKKHDIEFSYIVANPSTYLYFSEERPIAGTHNQFAVPEEEECPNYNKYIYGLNKLNSYMKNTGITKIKNQYANRHVIYLLGSKDNNPNSRSLVKGCRAMLQGAHRLARGQAYYNYLNHYFGSSIADKHEINIVAGVGHNSKKIFRSAEGLKYIFDY